MRAARGRSLCATEPSARASAPGPGPPVADLDSTVDKTCDIQGTASHDHTIALTVAQLQMLKEGQMVTVGSTTRLDHAHDVTTGCAMG